MPIDLAHMMNTAPSELQKLFDFMEAVPFRPEPYMEEAVLSHIASLGGCSNSLVSEQAQDDASFIKEAGMV